MKKYSSRNHFLYFQTVMFILAILAFLTASTFAQNNLRPRSVETIETEIGMDQIVDDAFGEDAENEGISLSVEERQMVKINKSLKNLIDENQELMKNSEQLQKEIEQLRGEKAIQDSRLNALARERGDLLKNSKEINSIKQTYEKQIADLTASIERTKGLTPEEIRMLTELESIIEKDAPVVSEKQQVQIASESRPMASQTQVSVMKGPEEIADELSELIEENQILRKDTIKLHYNLANLFFEQGKYQMASAEYKRVLDLMPQDAATHYNLAFVSEQYLDDYKTALKHYEIYLAMASDAEDINVVKNKILELKLKIQNKINSIIDKEKPY
ncbi:MAG: tetratricopeptide repeat protein [Candidatus Omnitrophica bacterium]|nr:tetratricopeptide repeat protein [Candidatus Omnitrophota bacterium]